MNVFFFIFLHTFNIAVDLFFSDLQRVSLVEVRTLLRAQFYIIFIYRKSILFADTLSRRTGRRCALNYPRLSKNFPFSASSIVKYLDRKCVRLVCRTQCGATADKFLLATRSFNRDMCVSMLTIRVPDVSCDPFPYFAEATFSKSFLRIRMISRNRGSHSRLTRILICLLEN